MNNNSNVKQPANSYYYPGGTIGGPIIIPHTNFNKNHDKLFFFTGFEYYKQTLDTGYFGRRCRLQVSSQAISRLKR